MVVHQAVAVTAPALARNDGRQLSQKIAPVLVVAKHHSAVIAAIGEVIPPKGSSVGMHSQMMVLNPNAVEETEFRSFTPYMSDGRYLCEMRYAIGRFKY